MADVFSTECAERTVLGGKVSARLPKKVISTRLTPPPVHKVSNKTFRKLAATFLRGLESLRDPSQSAGRAKLLMILPPVFQIPIIHLAAALSTELDLIISSSSDSEEAFSEQLRFVIVDEVNMERVINKLLANGSSRSTRPLVIVVESDKSNVLAMKDLAGQVREDIDVVLWMDVIVTGIDVEEKATLEGRELSEWMAPSRFEGCFSLQHSTDSPILIASSDVHAICYINQGNGSQILKLTLTHEVYT